MMLWEDFWLNSATRFLRSSGSTKSSASENLVPETPPSHGLVEDSHPSSLPPFSGRFILTSPVSLETCGTAGGVGYEVFGVFSDILFCSFEFSSRICGEVRRIVVIFGRLSQLHQFFGNARSLGAVAGTQVFLLVGYVVLVCATFAKWDVGSLSRCDAVRFVVYVRWQIFHRIFLNVFQLSSPIYLEFEYETSFDIFASGSVQGAGLLPRERFLVVNEFESCGKVNVNKRIRNVLFGLGVRITHLDCQFKTRRRCFL